MMTMDQLAEYMQEMIAADTLSGDTQELKRIQTAAGMIMAAAEHYHDQGTAHRFRVIAAHAANKQEEHNTD